MTGIASLLDEQLLSGGDRISRSVGGTGQPSGIVHRLHNGYPAAHKGMICAAILLAEKVVAAGLGGTEPHGVVVAGNNVHLDAKGRDGKIVNNVFAGEDELDVAADRNMQFIDFA